MKHYYLLLLLSFIQAISCFAQQNNRFQVVSGKITDKNNQPLSPVTITLIDANNTLHVSKIVTSKSGNFSFSKIDAGNYTVVASMIGYQAAKNKITVGNRNIELSDIILKQEIKVLKEVSVSSKKQTLEMINGKLVYNVEQSAAAAGSSALDLLRRLPGVNVDADENLLLKGSANVNVMLDGKMTYLSAQQLSNMLKGMGSDNISRIEITGTPSVQYAAAGNAGLINIITKKSTKQGYAANISAGISVGRYVLHSENITGNVKTDKFNFFATLGYNYRHSFSDKTTFNTVTNNGVTTIFDRRFIDPRISPYYTYKAGVDVYLSKNQTVGLVYSGYLDNWSRDLGGTTYLRNNSGDINGSVQNQSVAVEPYYNNIYNFNYKLKLDTLGKIISADADYVSYTNNSDGFIGNQEFDRNGSIFGAYQQLNFHQPSYIDIRSLKTDVDLPFKKYRLKAGLKYSSVQTNNNFRYDSLINHNYVYSPVLSDHFIYTEQIAAAYLSAAKKWEKTNIDIGLRIERTVSDANSISSGIENKRDYTDFFPSVSVDQQLNRDHKLSFLLSRRINRPNYSSLNPVRYFTDKYAYYSGNPNLKPEKAWVASTTYTLMDKYIASLTYNRNNNFITEVIQLDAASGILISQNANLSHKDRYDLMLIAPLKITSYWNVSTTTDLSYTSYPLMQLSGFFTAKRFNADLGINQNFNLPKSFGLEVIGHYTSPELLGVYLTRYYYQIDGGIKKTFLNKKLDARFAFSDLFHTNRYWAYSISNLVNYSYKYIPDSRRFSLTMIYHLGAKLNPSKTHQTEEQNRL